MVCLVYLMLAGVMFMIGPMARKVFADFDVDLPGMTLFFIGSNLLWCGLFLTTAFGLAVKDFFRIAPQNRFSLNCIFFMLSVSFFVFVSTAMVLPYIRIGLHVTK